MENIFTKIGLTLFVLIILALVAFADMWAIEIVKYGLQYNKMALVVLGGILLLGIPLAIGKVILDARKHFLTEA